MARPLIHLVEATPGAIAGAGAGILSTDRDAPYSKKDVAKIVGGTILGGATSAGAGRAMARRNVSKFNEAHSPERTRKAIDTIIEHAADPKSTYKSRAAVAAKNLPTVEVAQSAPTRKAMADQISDSYFGRATPQVPDNIKNLVDDITRHIGNRDPITLSTLKARKPNL